jgi:hypothetical protein
MVTDGTFACLVVAVLLFGLILYILQMSRHVEEFNSTPFVIKQFVANERQSTCVFIVNVNFTPGAVSVMAWQNYCRHHGYDLVELNDPFYEDVALGIAWWRIRALQELFALGYDVIMHVDADTVPITLEVSVEDHMRRSERDTTIFWVSQDNLDGNYAYFESINFGIFIMKNDETNLRMLQDVWKERYQRKDWPREQGAICDWLVKAARSLDAWNTSYHVSLYGDWQTFGIIGAPNARNGEFSNNLDYIANVMIPSTNAWIYHAVGIGGDRTKEVQTALLQTVYTECIIRNAYKVGLRGM